MRSEAAGGLAASYGMTVVGLKKLQTPNIWIFRLPALTRARGTTLVLRLNISRPLMDPRILLLVLVDKRLQFLAKFDQRLVPRSVHSTRIEKVFGTFVRNDGHVGS
jgi:hypothetical protein